MYLKLAVGIIRHYVMVLLHREKNVTLTQMKDSQALLRSLRLRKNGGFLPQPSFVMRKQFFNDEEKGYFKTEKRDSAPPNPISDPTMMVDMVKGNLTNIIPMMVIGGWINWTFSGFVATKVPFPLTTRFKGMLQRGVFLTTLDASWVSSASWYFLNFFGLRSVFSLILGDSNAADQTHLMMGVMPEAAQDPAKALTKEWEALQICHHEWELDGIEEDIVQRSSRRSHIKDKHV